MPGAAGTVSLEFEPAVRFLLEGTEMRNLDCLNAEKLLSINSPESLFSSSAAEAKKEYRLLALRWHPDNSKEAEAVSVFSHIAQLYRQAQTKLSDGSWDEPVEKAELEQKGMKRFRMENGRIKEVDYLAIHPFELGTMYVGDHHVTYQVSSDFTDLFQNGRRQIRELRFQDEDMSQEMSRYLPQMLDAYRTKNFNFLVVRKTPDQLLLADVLKQFADGIEPIEHIGWIINVLLNVCCYLEWSGLTHNAISASNFFISPLRHSGALLGGWWYSVPAGSTLSALPDRTVDIMPPDILVEKTAIIRTDLELVRAIGRELLGSAALKTGSADCSVAVQLNEWLILPSLGEAVADYRDWKYKVLEDCFGEPKFVPMHLTSANLYKEV
jgi:hypothetical protein